MAEETLIDILPASDFLGRQVKVHWRDSKTTHPSTAICRGPGNKGKVLVELTGGGQGKKVVEVDAKRVEPWWSKNPDLKEKRDEILAAKKDVDSMAQLIDQASARVLRGAVPAVSTNPRELPLAAPVPAHHRKVVVAHVPAPVVKPAPTVSSSLGTTYTEAPKEKPPVLDLLPPEPTPVAEDFDETSPPPPPPLPTPPTKKVTEPTPPAKTPVQHDYRNFHGVTATIQADPTWAMDFAELQQTFAAIKADEDQIAELLGKIDEKRDMIGLIVQELEKKKVTVLWNTPVKVHGVHPTTGDPELMLKVEAWIATRPLSFTYAAAAKELGVPDVALFRGYLKKVAMSVGYFVGRAPGYQSPMIFNRPV